MKSLPKLFVIQFVNKKHGQTQSIRRQARAIYAYSSITVGVNSVLTCSCSLSCSAFSCASLFSCALSIFSEIFFSVSLAKTSTCSWMRWLASAARSFSFAISDSLFASAAYQKTHTHTHPVTVHPLSLSPLPPFFTLLYPGSHLRFLIHSHLLTF
jgi:hypothetical protein